MPTLFFTDGEKIFRDDQWSQIIPDDRNRSRDDPRRGLVYISNICGLTITDEQQQQYFVAGTISVNDIHQQNKTGLFFKLMG